MVLRDPALKLFFVRIRCQVLIGFFSLSSLISYFESINVPYNFHFIIMTLIRKVEKTSQHVYFVSLVELFFGKNLGIILISLLLGSLIKTKLVYGL